jgi:conjugative transfer signal peptidase TraF
MAKAGNFLRPRQDKRRGPMCAVRGFPLISGSLAGVPERPRAASALWFSAVPDFIGYVLLGLVAALIIIAGLGWSFDARIVPTSSAAPAGIYLLQKIGEPLAMTWDQPGLPIIAEPHRGELVLACLPVPIAAWAMQRHYIAGGSCPGGAEPVVKILAAIQGDEVVVDSGFVAINKVHVPHSQTAVVDSQGRPLPHVAWGPRQVAAGEVWLFGFNHPHSWDARYFGAIPADNVRGILQPLVTW